MSAKADAEAVLTSRLRTNGWLVAHFGQGLVANQTYKNWFVSETEPALSADERTKGEIRLHPAAQDVGDDGRLVASGLFALDGKPRAPFKAYLKVAKP